MSARQEAIRAIYAQIDAPQWAAPNLDGLADLLRDLSWLPHGPVNIVVPDLSDLEPDERRALMTVLDRAAEQSTRTSRLVHIQH